jgi:hypothetical protein
MPASTAAGYAAQDYIDQAPYDQRRGKAPRARSMTSAPESDPNVVGSMPVVTRTSNETTELGR